jgi:hypothetical protein
MAPIGAGVRTMAELHKLLRGGSLKWVESGHGGFNLRCPLLSAKRTFIAAIGMSALGHFRTRAPQQIEMLIDHVVSERKQLIWDIQTECLRGLAVDHELKICRLDNW